MPTYEFRCQFCRTTQHEPVNDPPPECLMCGRKLGRRYGFNIGKPFDPHMNATTGTYVSSQRGFEDDLKRIGDRQSERFGIEHRYVPVDMNDKAALGVTDELPHEVLERDHARAK
jgi:hypothetical protein